MFLRNSKAKPLFVLSSSDVISRYHGLIDVSPYFEGIESLALYEDECGLMQWMPTVLGDSVFYENLSKCVNPYYPSVKKEYEAALPFVCDSKMVLEIGCGEGHFGAMLPLGQWFGVDINSAAVKTASGKGLPCKVWNFIEDSADSLPVTDIDMICSFQTIEHLSQPSFFFDFASRILQRGGKLLVGAPAHDSILGRFPFGALNLPPHHQTWWSDRALEEFPRQFGFSCRRIHHCEVDLFHKRWFFKEFIAHIIESRFNSVHPMPRRLAKKLALRFLSAITPRLIDDSTSFDPIFGARGQSVLALYEKE